MVINLPGVSESEDNEEVTETTEPIETNSNDDDIEIIEPILPKIVGGPIEITCSDGTKK